MSIFSEKEYTAFDMWDLSLKKGIAHKKKDDGSFAILVIEIKGKNDGENNSSLTILPNEEFIPYEFYLTLESNFETVLYHINKNRKQPISIESTIVEGCIHYARGFRFISRSLCFSAIVDCFFPCSDVEINEKRKCLTACIEDEQVKAQRAERIKLREEKPLNVLIQNWDLTEKSTYVLHQTNHAWALLELSIVGIDDSLSNLEVLIEPTSEYIPSEFKDSIKYGAREFFMNNIKYREGLISVKVTIKKGCFHLVDSTALGFQICTKIGLSDCFTDRCREHQKSIKKRLDSFKTTSQLKKQIDLQADSSNSFGTYTWTSKEWKRVGTDVNDEKRLFDSYVKGGKTIRREIKARLVLLVVSISVFIFAVSNEVYLISIVPLLCLLYLSYLILKDRNNLMY